MLVLRGAVVLVRSTPLARLARLLRGLGLLELLRLTRLTRLTRLARLREVLLLVLLLEVLGSLALLCFLHGVLGLGVLLFKGTAALHQEEDAEGEGNQDVEEPEPPAGTEGSGGFADDADEEDENGQGLETGSDNAEDGAELLFAQEEQNGSGDVAAENHDGAQTEQETTATDGVLHLVLDEGAQTGSLSADCTPPVQRTIDGSKSLEARFDTANSKEAGEEAQQEETKHEPRRPCRVRLGLSWLLRCAPLRLTSPLLVRLRLLWLLPAIRIGIVRLSHDALSTVENNSDQRNG